MTYVRDIFYDTSVLSYQDKVQILHEAKQLCYKWQVDILDCSKSFSRQKIDMSFKEILSKFNDDAHFVVISRKGLDPEEYNLEIAFRTMDIIDHFLWIYLQETHIDHFVNKYNLKKIL